MFLVSSVIAHISFLILIICVLSFLLSVLLNFYQLYCCLPIENYLCFVFLYCNCFQFYWFSTCLSCPFFCLLWIIWLIFLKGKYFIFDLVSSSNQQWAGNFINIFAKLLSWALLFLDICSKFLFPAVPLFSSNHKGGTSVSSLCHSHQQQRKTKSRVKWWEVSEKRKAAGVGPTPLEPQLPIQKTFPVPQNFGPCRLPLQPLT